MRIGSILWVAAGRPGPRKPVVTAAGQACYWCGLDPIDEGLACRVRDVCGDTFTDHDGAARPASPVICRGCAWTMTGRPPDTLRGWSLIYREDASFDELVEDKAPLFGPQVRLLRYQRTELRRVLVRPPPGAWACGVVTSKPEANIHVVPHVTMNRGNGAWRVRVGREDAHGQPDAFGLLAARCDRLLEYGFSRDGILHGAPHPAALARAGAMEAWCQAERILLRCRGTALLRLALHVARSAGDAGKPKEDA